MQEQQLAKDNLCLKVVTGSHLYGFSTNESDVDYQGIFIPPKEYVYGMRRCEQVILQEKHKNEKIDYTCYNLLKFIQLARNNNPNIISILYTPDNRICFKNKYGDRLRENRDAFLSKKCHSTYKGYAFQQKQKLISKNPQPDSKRRELVDKYGFDVKYGSHLIRLLTECLEILVCHTITYPLANAKQLLEIRHGKYSLDWVFTECTRLEHLVDEAYVKSDLQWSPNDKKIEQLQMSILEEFWNSDK